jgi:cyclase
VLKIRVIPCLLLRNQGLVKTVRFKEPKYVGDPINTVKIFNEKEVDELVFLDITATTEDKRPNLKILSEIASECFMPLGYGGGIREIDDIKNILGLGVEKVIINSQAVETPAFVNQAADLFGSQSIVLSIDARKNRFGNYEIFTHGGKKGTGLDPVPFSVRMQGLGAGELLLTSIDRDGTMAGYDLELTRRVSESVDIPVIACGGAGKLEDFADAVKIGGASAVAAGSFFVFQGKHRAVLIQFPAPGELRRLFGSS